MSRSRYCTNRRRTVKSTHPLIYPWPSRNESRVHGHPAFHLAASPTTEPAPSFRCQTNGFARLYQYVALEPDLRGSGGHRITLVTRYLLVSRVEEETNNDLKSSSSLGSDWPSGLYNSMGKSRLWYAFTTSLSLWC